MSEEKKWSGTWPAPCDICRTSLSEQPVFIDGKTLQGPWALMCATCHSEYGVGFGTSKGQMYQSNSLIKLRG